MFAYVQTHHEWNRICGSQLPYSVLPQVKMLSTRIKTMKGYITYCNSAVTQQHSTLSITRVIVDLEPLQSVLLCCLPASPSSIHTNLVTFPILVFLFPFFKGSPLCCFIPAFVLHLFKQFLHRSISFHLLFSGTVFSHISRSTHF